MQYFTWILTDLINRLTYGFLILLTGWNTTIPAANLTTYYSVKGISTWNTATEQRSFCKSASSPHASITYQPMVQSIPTRHIGKGKLGFCQSLPAVKEDFILQVLTPPQTGLTFSAQPTLYWWVSKPIAAYFVFYLAEAESNHQPLLNKTLFLAISEPGIQSFSLSQYLISLEKNIEYKWSITLVCDSPNLANRIFTEGRIKYLQPTFDTTQQNFALYAQHGFWYDALDTVSKLINSHSTNKTFRQARALLLQQGELPEEILAYN
jgi:hypothetical protein